MQDTLPFPCSFLRWPEILPRCRRFGRTGPSRLGLVVSPGLVFFPGWRLNR